MSTRVICQRGREERAELKQTEKRHTFRHQRSHFHFNRNSSRPPCCTGTAQHQFNPHQQPYIHPLPSVRHITQCIDPFGLLAIRHIITQYSLIFKSLCKLMQNGLWASPPQRRYFYRLRGPMHTEMSQTFT